jgi:thioredoxin:protein disulfide reductase
MMRNLLIGIFILIATTSAFAQLDAEGQVLEGQFFTSYQEVTPGQEFDAVLVAAIKPGLHVNSHTPEEEYLIPTEFRIAPTAQLSIGGIDYPSPAMKKFAFSENRLSVYEGTIRIYVSLQVAPNTPPGPLEITGSLSYQGCNDNSCFAPSKSSIKGSITVVPAGTAVNAVNGNLFDARPSHTAQAVTAGLTSDESRAMRILEHGMIYAVFAFFLVGLALNLTPCVYPIIPLTVSYFGGQSGRSRGSSFISALFYLLGIALSFALLGVLSGLAGKQWGFLFQSPWFVVIIATIILLMAASMFGAFEITVPSSWLTRFGGSREGIFGALIMGLTVGVLIAPCAAGIIVGLVGLVAKLGLVVKGGLLFFIMGLGLGLPYLILATFSGLLNRLPQSGMWMIWIKKLFGILLIGVALYFLVPQIERVYNKQYFLLGLLAIVGGLLLGFLDHTEASRGFKRFRGIAGIMMLLLGLHLTHTAIESKPVTIPWIHYSGQPVSQWTAAGKPVFMDFYADWCAPCKQLERETFSDPKVQEAFKAFSLIKIDCTKPDEATRAFMNQFKVSGMPTLIFLQADGRELEELREVGFIGPDKFLHSLQRAQQGN